MEDEVLKAQVSGASEMRAGYFDRNFNKFDHFFQNSKLTCLFEIKWRLFLVKKPCS